MTVVRVEEVLVEVAAAQARLEAVAGGLGAADVRAPSALEGWTRGHVLTHLARNAESQTAMVAGAQRGEIVPQYPGGDEQRAADIERGATRSIAALVDDLAEAHAGFLAAAATMSPADWDRTTRPRAGERPAWASAWARWREVEVHTADLALPPDPRAPRLSAAFTGQFLPPELDRLALRLPESLTGSAPDAIVLTGDPAARLLWLMGRPADSVSLRVGGSVVAQDALGPWARTAWMPGDPERPPG